MYHKIILDKILDVYNSGMDQDWAGEESALSIKIIKDYGDGTKYMRYEYRDPFFEEFKHIMIHNNFTERGNNNKLLTIFEPEVFCTNNGEYLDIYQDEFKFLSKKIPHMRRLGENERAPSLPPKDRRKSKI